MTWRGGEQQLAYLLEGLQKKALYQTVYCYKGSEIEKYCLTNNISVHTFHRSSAFNPLLLRDFTQLCQRLKIEIIHAHDAHGHTVAVLSAALFRNRIPIVLSRKVDFPIKNNFFSRYKYNYPTIKKIICVSNKIEEILSKDLRNKQVLTTIYDGIDFLRFQANSNGILRKEFQISADEFIIGNIAAIASHKDYFTFVDVAKILLAKKIKAKFLIVGEGPERPQIEAYITENNLNNDIILTGFRHDISKILPEFDLLLFTSKTEGLGSSILDAYACKVAVVATQAGGIPEIVIHEQTGLLAPVQNAPLLAENVLKLLSQPDLKQKLVSQAFNFMQQFSKEKMADLTYNTYLKVHSGAFKA
jgi:glycosyltransferase involved in cell wall biosynthesis